MLESLLVHLLLKLLRLRHDVELKGSLGLRHGQLVLQLGHQRIVLRICRLRVAAAALLVESVTCQLSHLVVFGRMGS